LQLYLYREKELKCLEHSKIIPNTWNKYQAATNEILNYSTSYKNILHQIQYNKGQFQFINKENKYLLENIKHLQSVPPPLHERIFILETALEQANSLLKQSFKLSKKQY